MAAPVKPSAILVGDFVRKADGTIFQVAGIAVGRTSAMLSEVTVVPKPPVLILATTGDTVIWGT